MYRLPFTDDTASPQPSLREKVGLGKRRFKANLLSSKNPRDPQSEFEPGVETPTPRVRSRLNTNQSFLQPP